MSLSPEAKDERIAVLEREIAEDKHIHALKAHAGVQGFRFGVQGLGFRVSGLGCRGYKKTQLNSNGF